MVMLSKFRKEVFVRMFFFFLATVYVSLGYTQDEQIFDHFISPSMSTRTQSDMSVFSLLPPGGVFYFDQTVPLSIGTVSIGSQKTMKWSVVISPVELTQINLTIIGSPDFTLQQNGCFEIPNISPIRFFQRCYFDIIFTPTVEGEQSATVPFPYNNYVGGQLWESGTVYYVFTGSTGRKDFRIEKNILGESNSNYIEMEPSVKACGRIPGRTVSKAVNLRCIETSGRVEKPSNELDFEFIS